MILLDTNIVIDHLRTATHKMSLLSQLFENTHEKVALSTISIQELYSGKSTKELSKEHSLLTTIQVAELLPYTSQIAQLAGTLIRDLTTPITFADAGIASTAIQYGIPLYTLNIKDFERIPGIELYTP